jgi:hypothetical protein
MAPVLELISLFPRPAVNAQRNPALAFCVFDSFWHCCCCPQEDLRRVSLHLFHQLPENLAPHVLDGLLALMATPVSAYLLAAGKAFLECAGHEVHGAYGCCGPCLHCRLCLLP